MMRTALTGIFFVTFFAGCAGEEGVRCEDPSYYQSSATVPPIRVPDDLSVPSESDSLLIPDVAGSSSAQAPTAEQCLESPPDFFGDEAPN